MKQKNLRTLMKKKLNIKIKNKKKKNLKIIIKMIIEYKN
jgi:hypothetical protein